jgi:1-acyl-sn-glycerol-3-phosphate acyltransferase
MIAFRSILFHIAFFAFTAVVGLACLPVLALPRRAVRGFGRWWCRTVAMLLERIVGLTHEVRGRAHAPAGPVIYAFKHQSAWETLAMPTLLDDPAVVLKQELMLIPVFGWYVLRHDMIPVDRGGRARALRRMLAAARRAAEAGRPIVIFPEGTRTSPGERRPYHRGVVALYRALGLPVVPVALNSGLFWRRRSFIRRPGRITVAFLPPIPPGLDGDTFLSVLEERIETHSAALIENLRTPVAPVVSNETGTFS